MPLPRCDGIPRPFVCPCDIDRPDPPTFWLKPEPSGVQAARAAELAFISRSTTLDPAEQARRMTAMHQHTFLDIVAYATNVYQVGDRVDNIKQLRADLDALPDAARISIVVREADVWGDIDGLGKASFASPSSGDSSPAPLATPG